MHARQKIIQKVIFILKLEFLLKCLMTIIPRLNKLLENKTQNKWKKKKKKKKKEKEDMSAFENINSAMYLSKY